MKAQMLEIYRMPGSCCNCTYTYNFTQECLVSSTLFEELPAHVERSWGKPAEHDVLKGNLLCLYVHVLIDQYPNLFSCFSIALSCRKIGSPDLDWENFRRASEARFRNPHQEILPY